VKKRRPLLLPTDPPARRSAPRRRLALATCAVALVGGAIAVGLAVSGASSPAAEKPPVPCSVRAREASLVSVVPDAGLNRAWSEYVATNKGWTDGDSVYAYAVPGLGTVWSFADSYVGGLLRDGGRLPGIYHNLFVVSHGNSYRVVTGPHSTPLVGPRNGLIFYLPAGGAVSGSTFDEFLVEELRTGQESLDIRPIGTVLASFELPSLQLVSVTAVHGATGVLWGAYVTRFGGFTYVYGASAAPLDKSAYVARIAGTDLRSTWKYWDGHAWSADAAAAAPILSDVGQEYSVTSYDGLYVLLTTDGSQPFSPYAEVRFGCSPIGPFGTAHRFLVNNLVFAKGAATWHDANVYVYDELVQSALSTGSHLVVSYDRNSLDSAAVLVDAAIYRPTYVDLQLRVPPA
jgi:hypothetical protein